MNNKEKVFELLQKDILTEEDKLLIERLSGEDPETSRFIDIYKKINDVVKSSSHLSYDEIGNYILFKNNLAPDYKNVIKIFPGIEEHLRNCEKCKEDFKLFNEEFNSIEAFVGSELKKGNDKVSSPAEILSKRKFNVSRYAFLSIIFAGLLYVIMFTVSKVTTPRYYDLAALNNKTDFYATRGRATGEFLKSLNELDEGNISKAIIYLKGDIKNHPEDKTIFYSYYILGLTYLDNAERDFIGLFPHYNSNYAEQAARNFQNAIQKNNSGNYRNITLDAYFYLAKANIMMDKKKDAREDLTIVINEKGSKMSEAKKILNGLD